MTDHRTATTVAGRDASAAGAQHDFNNAMQALTSSLRLLEKMVAQSRTAALPTMIEAMGNQITRISSLGALLARTAPIDLPSPLPLIAAGPFLHAMIPQVAALLDGHIRLETIIAADTGHVACDPARLESAIRNLVLNARDAMPEGGLLMLRSGTGPDTTGILPGPFVTITIADTGCGMTPAILATCFEPFVTTKTLRGGTGLGLFQLRTFAAEAGGTVRLHSQEGRGTEVSLLLPCCEPPRHDHPLSAAQDGNWSNGHAE